MAFEHEGVTISARKLSIGDNDDLGDLLMKLPEDKRTTRMFRFLEFVVAHVTEGGALIPPVDARSTAADIETAYQVYRELPRSFQTQWQDELQAVEGDPKASS